MSTPLTGVDTGSAGSMGSSVSTGAPTGNSGNVTTTNNNTASNPSAAADATNTSQKTNTASKPNNGGQPKVTITKPDQNKNGQQPNQPAKPGTAAQATQNGQNAGSETESVGMKQLRAHSDGLKRDLDAAKGQLAKLDDVGGYEAIEPLINLHNSFATADPKTFREKHALNIAKQLAAISGQNYGEFAKFMAESYPGLVEHGLQFHKEYQEFQRWKEAGGELEDDFSGLDEKTRNELKQLKESDRQRKEHEEQQKIAKQKVETEQRVNRIDSMLIDPMKKELAKLEGWDPRDIRAVAHDVIGEIKADPTTRELYEKLIEAAQKGSGTELGAETKFQRLINNKIKESIEYKSQFRSSQSRTTTNQTASGQPAKKLQLNAAGSGPAPTPKVDINDNQAIADNLLKRFSKKR